MSAQLPPSIIYSQNYLKNERLVADLLDKSSLGGDDLVYEIGPGKGILTGQLARRCRQVIAIEKDPRLAAMLQQKFAGWPGVTIRAGDFLRDHLPTGPYKVFANIPFNITSAIVARLAGTAHPPEDAYLVMQKEAARVYLGNPDETLRAVLLKPWFEVEIVHRFRRRDFVPEPRVDVVMLRLHKRGPPLVSLANRQLFCDFIVYGFTAWKPALRCTFRDVFSRQQRKHIQSRLEIDLNGTPTSLRFEQWLKLFNFFSEAGSEAARRTVSGSAKRLIWQQKRLHKIHRTHAVR
jgi:16S rRNA A1518/A1519 N6-dimethyltransferase RsmA/KsgA/DIM1 with predicted DNA glycosylase/AP lyase activity